MPDDSLASRDLADGLSGGAAPSVSARPPLPPTLILASGSVQRRYIMASNQLRFMVEGSYVDEDQIKAYAFNAGLAVVSTALMIARAKAAAVATRFPKAVVLAADTIGFIDGIRLDKPMTVENATRDLRRLSGRVLEMVTGVSIWADGEEVAGFIRAADIAVRQLTDAEIADHLQAAGPQALLTVGSLGDGRHIRSDIATVVSGDPCAALGLPLRDILLVPEVAATQVYP